jgi:hypothetical protein
MNLDFFIGLGIGLVAGGLGAYLGMRSAIKDFARKLS